MPEENVVSRYIMVLLKGKNNILCSNYIPFGVYLALFITVDCTTVNKSSQNKPFAEPNQHDNVRSVIALSAWLASLSAVR